MTPFDASDHDLARTVALLGGSGTLHPAPRTVLEAHDRVQEGLPAAALTHLADEVALFGGAPDKLERAFGISLRTLQRRRKDATEMRLRPEQSGRLW